MSEAGQQSHRWLQHRGVVQQLLEELDPGRLDYKPWPDAYSLGALVVHIATSSDMFLRSITKGAFTPPALGSSYETIDDLKELVKQSTESGTAVFAELSDKHLEQPLDFNGFIAPGKVWLSNMIDHEIHHKGQLFTYARSVGARKLPFFIVQPSKE
ncbi:DinB family protein [Paenibacillus sp. JCM 10914]|uniref:DinB family protein n=1 Tax=Paenibacillus sp. JCM 10914 TaxID=1236974 RepID=UPI0003CC551F|nr:DinB family protein [Paenibacillus sp. JCM 10914]GAE07174.1 hypothetical protein JCM10914_3387 [Paenibacillus sp. JCM 10914]